MNRSRSLLACAILLFAGPAWADEPAPAAGPVPPPPGPPPVAPDPADAERERAAREALRALGEAPEVVVRGAPLEHAVPLRLDGPREGLVSTSPLGFGGGPVVPIAAGGARDVLSPRRVRDLTPTTVEEVANRLPGVSSRLYSGDEHVRPSISVRGMPDNGFTEYTAVLVDGFNMSTLFYGWTAISIFPFTPERIWAAEVYRGAHALRYGPNTIGGVVNFVTAPIPVDPTVRQRTVFGSHDYHATVSEVGGMDPSRRFGALVTFVEKGGDTFRDSARFDVNEIAWKTRWNVDSCSWLAFDGAHWRAVHGLPGRLTKAQLDEDRTQSITPSDVDWHGWAYWGTLTYHRDFGCDAWVEAFLYHRKARRALDSARPPAGPPFTAIRSADSDNYNSGVEVRGELPFHLGVRHLLHYGARWHREEIQRTTFEDPIGGGPRTVTQDAGSWNHAFAANVDDTVEIGRFTVNAGVRFEWMFDSYAHDEVTGGRKDFEFRDVFPGASVAYALTPCWTLFANAHRSFRAPQTFSYDFTNPDQDLDFEHGTNLEVGTRFRDARGFQGSVVLWQTDFSDFIEFDPDEMVTTNHGAFRSRGIDLVVEAGLDRLARPLRGLSVFGNATYQESEFREGQNRGNDTQYVAPWIASGGVRYEHPSGLYGVLDASWRDDMPVTADNAIDTPGYAVFGARAGWRRECRLGCAKVELEAAVGVKNLFDREYHLRHADLGGTTSTLYVPGAPREFFLDLALAIEL
jgi:Fe(3+) dicitrate transport protein